MIVDVVHWVGEGFVTGAEADISVGLVVGTEVGVSVTGQIVVERMIVSVVS